MITNWINQQDVVENISKTVIYYRSKQSSDRTIPEIVSDTLVQAVHADPSVALKMVTACVDALVKRNALPLEEKKIQASLEFSLRLIEVNAKIVHYEMQVSESRRQIDQAYDLLKSQILPLVKEDRSLMPLAQSLFHTIATAQNNLTSVFIAANSSRIL